MAIEVFESNGGYRIVPGAKAQNLTDDILEYIYDEGGFVPNQEDIPMPWDADVEVKDGNLVITGGLTPGGGSKGRCVITCPLQEANKLYHADLFDVPVSVLNKIMELGWGVKSL